MEQEQLKRKSNRSPPYALFNLLVIIVAIIYGAYYQMYLSKPPSDPETVADVQEANDSDRIPLFTAEELKKFDGISKYFPTFIRLRFPFKNWIFSDPHGIHSLSLIQVTINSTYPYWAKCLT